MLRLIVFDLNGRLIDSQMGLRIGDTRTALERHHICCAMWDYCENLGLAAKSAAELWMTRM